jgi:peptidoglycan/xylan/chitin deacetylase (PgdA/CDA1 family)
MTASEVLLCFDFEGRFGMPFTAPYDIEAGTHRILETLARHEARAIFFIVGALAVEQPELVAEISSAGHEIGLHGWRHERLDRLSATDLASFAAGIDEAGAVVEAVTGSHPTGFRAPHLLAPKFFDASVYELLAARGYRWTSNRELRFVIELVRPDRVGGERPWQFLVSHPGVTEGPAAELLKLALNARVYMSQLSWRSMSTAYRWFREGCPPFHLGSLLEIPLYSPMDCDLLGIPDPAASTPRGLHAYTKAALESSLAQSGRFSMLTFHDWIIAGANRLELLDAMLAFMAAARMRTVGVEERWPELTELAWPNGHP